MGARLDTTLAGRSSTCRQNACTALKWPEDQTKNHLRGWASAASFTARSCSARRTGCRVRLSALKLDGGDDSAQGGGAQPTCPYGQDKGMLGVMY